jgi:hypothetical protein
MVQQIGKLIQFLFGDFEGALTSRPQFGSGFQQARRNNERIRKLLPVVREYAPQLRDFGTLLLARLTEKSLSRGLKWASQRLNSAASLA